MIENIKSNHSIKIAIVLITSLFFLWGGLVMGLLM